MLNSTAIASGYASRDPQGGTSDGSFFSKFSFWLQRMVKDLLLILKRKRKINYNQVRKKVVNREGGENESGYVQRIEKD